MCKGGAVKRKNKLEQSGIMSPFIPTFTQYLKIFLKKEYSSWLRVSYLNEITPPTVVRASGCNRCIS